VYYKGMPRAKDIEVSVGEYYHLYTRGVGKKDIFLDDRDYARFLFCILYFQYDKTFYNISNWVTRFLNTGTFASSSLKKEESPNKASPAVELVAFALMPNHIHLIVREIKEGGIAHFMKRVLGGYAKYFNAKYKTSGHVFQGAYNAVHIKDNEQLLYVSAYIHRNPRELRGWKNREEKYPWSSFSDYTTINRWSNLLKPEIILEQFSKKSPYRDFVNTSTAKSSPEEMELFVDL
jgi:putative transposase